MALYKFRIIIIIITVPMPLPPSSGGSKKGAEGNVSAKSYLTSNAHNELWAYAFYAEKSDVLKKSLRPIGCGRPRSSEYATAARSVSGLD